MKRLLSLIPAAFGLSPVYAYGAIAGLIVVFLGFGYGCRSYNKYANYKKQKIAIDKVEKETIKKGQSDVEADVKYLKNLKKKNKEIEKSIKNKPKKDIKVFKNDIKIKIQQKISDDKELNKLKEELKKDQFERLERVLQ